MQQIQSLFTNLTNLFNLMPLKKICTSSNLKWSEFMFFIQLWHLSDIFNRAFLDKSVPKATTINLLRRACNRHQDAYRDAMSGQGIDRHLFALYVISKGMGYVRICIWCILLIFNTLFKWFIVIIHVTVSWNKSILWIELVLMWGLCIGQTKHYKFKLFWNSYVDVMRIRW